MNKEFSVTTLKLLIAEYDEQYARMLEMKQLYDEYDDPSADPGLQFEQESNVEKALKEVKDYFKVQFENVDVFGDMRRIGLSSDQCMVVSDYIEGMFNK